MEIIKRDWLSNIKADLLSSFVVGLSMIPETAGFAIMVGLSPMVAFYTTFCMAIVVSILGGRKAMISAAAGSVALILVMLAKSYGIEYVTLATIGAGLIQILFGIFKIGRLLKYIPKAVMFGFVNALAILLLKEQVHFFYNQGYIMYLLVAIGLVIIYTFPFITKKIPSHLIAIIVVTAIVMILKLKVASLGSIGNISVTLSPFVMPKVPIDLSNIIKVLPYSISLALVGTIESLLTAKTLDEIIGDKESNKNRETVAQGIGNLVSGFFSGMTGCALVGQSIINAKSGARTRLSTIFAGVSLMIMVSIFSTYVSKIPIAALVAVMIMISLTTFNFESVVKIRKIKIFDTILMIITVVIVLLTGNLAVGVIVGTLINLVKKKFEK
ncbi:MAG: SulP family inorganic anion transporter [Sarcina sp.]